MNTSHLVDTHCHILPGIDDGSTSMEMSVAMARRAVQAGVGTIVATPHRIKGTYDNSFALITKKVHELNKELKKKKIPLTILFGAENYSEIDVDFRFSINHKKYFLLEFPVDSYSPFFNDIISDAFKKKVIPVIAHPERNIDIRENPKIVEGLINSGCLLQLDAHSFFERDKDITDYALFLLKNNAYHMIASDAHSPHGYEEFSKALTIVKKHVQPEKFTELTLTIPGKIITGEQFVPAKVTFVEKKHTRFGFRVLAGKFFHI